MAIPNFLKLGQGIVLGRLATDPVDGVMGALYYNTTDNALRVYNGSSWEPLASGSVDLEGQTLDEYHIIVGNDSNLSEAINTDSAGSIRASAMGGLQYKDGSIGDIAIAAAAGIAYSKLDLTGGIVDADINAAAAIDYSKLSLAGSIVDSDINAAAGINYTKLDLADSIVNADIDTAAAIAYTKLATLTADSALVSNGSGYVSASSVTATELGYLSGVTSAIQTQLNDKLNLSGGTMSGTLNMDGNSLTGLPAPTLASDAAPKSYVDAAVNGLAWKASVRAATTANITLSGPQTIDGVSIIAGQRVLVLAQTDAEDNGIYVAAAGAWSRSTDMDSWSEVPAAAVFVEEGTANGDKAFVCVSDQGGTLGTTDIDFVQFSASAAYTGGDGITITGNDIAIDQDGQGLQFSGGQLALELDGSTLSKSASGVKVADLGIANAQISNSAAIAYSKLNLSASIVNADVAAAAAIDYSKLAALTTARALVSDGSGFVSASSVTATELGYLSGVTSSIQTQLGAKLNLSGGTMSGNITMAGNDLLTVGSITGNTGEALALTAATNQALNLTASGSGTVNASAPNISLSADTELSFDAAEVEWLDRSNSSEMVAKTFLESNIVLAANISTPTAIPALTWAHASYRGAIIDYTIEQADGEQRTGRMIVANNGTVVGFTDQYAETDELGAAAGLSFSAAIDGTDVEISYDDTHATEACVMRAFVTLLPAD